MFKIFSVSQRKWLLTLSIIVAIVSMILISNFSGPVMVNCKYTRTDSIVDNRYYQFVDNGGGVLIHGSTDNDLSNCGCFMYYIAEDKIYYTTNLSSTSYYELATIRNKFTIDINGCEYSTSGWLMFSYYVLNIVNVACVGGIIGILTNTVIVKIKEKSNKTTETKTKQ